MEFWPKIFSEARLVSEDESDLIIIKVMMILIILMKGKMNHIERLNFASGSQFMC